MPLRGRPRIFEDTPYEDVKHHARRAGGAGRCGRRLRRHASACRYQRLPVRTRRPVRQDRARQDHHGPAHEPEDRQGVPDAVIFATRLDMAPDAMKEMVTKVTPVPDAEPGTYRFQATFGMAGRWQLTLGAKIQGETGTLENKLVVTAQP